MGSRSDDAYWNDKYSPPDCLSCEYGCDCDPDQDEEFGYVADEENDENTVLDEELKDETLEEGA